MARESPSWGYVRLQGALANLGHKLSDTTVGNILREHGIESVSERKRQSTWKEFLEAHGDVLGAIDFTTIEVWTKSGLVTFYLLFVMEVGTRRVHFAGCTTNPKDAGVKAVRLPPRSPNLNSHLERFMGGLKEECLDRMIFFGEASQRKATAELLAHYRGERNHQGLRNRLIEEGEEVARSVDPIQCRKRLGGMLRYYDRAAA